MVEAALVHVAVPDLIVELDGMRPERELAYDEAGVNNSSPLLAAATAVEPAAAHCKSLVTKRDGLAAVLC